MSVWEKFGTRFSNVLQCFLGSQFGLAVLCVLNVSSKLHAQLIVVSFRSCTNKYTTVIAVRNHHSGVSSVAVDSLHVWVSDSIPASRGLHATGPSHATARGLHTTGLSHVICADNGSVTQRGRLRSALLIPTLFAGDAHAAHHRRFTANS